MILVVPSAVITLMYFMFHNVPTRPGVPSPFNTACLILLVFRALHRWLGGSAPVGSLTRFIACLPILVYVSFWISLLGKSHPAPTRMICLIALGMPSLAAIAVWNRWRVENKTS